MLDHDREMIGTAGKRGEIVVDNEIVRVHKDRAECWTIFIEHIHGVMRKPEGRRMRLFLRGYRQAIDPARPAGKALGELRIADPHVKQRGACDRQRLEDSLDVGLVPRGRLVGPVEGLADLCHPGLRAVATACWGGGSSARLVRHGLFSSVQACRSLPRTHNATPSSPGVIDRRPYVL